MKEVIVKQLKKIETENEIKILFACESGSRGWGFPSPDSDWDVRFIYMHNVDWDVSLQERDDFINIPIDDEERFIIMCLSRKLKLLVDCYKESDEIIRIISARRADKKETRFYGRT